MICRLQILTKRSLFLHCVLPLLDLVTDWFGAVKNYSQPNSPFSNAIGFAMLLNLLLGPVISGSVLINYFEDVLLSKTSLVKSELILVLFYGTTMDANARKFFKFAPDWTLKVLFAVFAPILTTVEEITRIKSNYMKTNQIKSIKGWSTILYNLYFCVKFYFLSPDPPRNQLDGTSDHLLC